MTDPLTIHQAMAKVLADLPAIGKNQRNQQQGYQFRGIDDVLDALNPLLAKHGVFFVPEILERLTDARQTRNGGTMWVVNLHVRYTFYGPLGDSVTASAWGEGTDSGDKATQKAMTGALKYVLFQVFAIATHEQAEADSDRSTPERTTSARRPQSAGADSGTLGRESDRSVPATPARVEQSVSLPASSSASSVDAASRRKPNGAASSRDTEKPALAPSAGVGEGSLSAESPTSASPAAVSGHSPARESGTVAAPFVPGQASMDDAQSRASSIAAAGINILAARKKLDLPPLSRISTEEEWVTWQALLEQLGIEADAKAAS